MQKMFITKIIGVNIILIKSVVIFVASLTILRKTNYLILSLRVFMTYYG